MSPVINEKKLCDLLETKHWFRAGTPKQFIKLLEANAQGASLQYLAAIIWASSDNDVHSDDILDALKELEQAELDAFIKELYLSRQYIDYDLMIDDPCICYSFA